MEAAALLGFKEVPNLDDDTKSSNSRKLVPWLNWNEWLFVRDALFSDSHHSLSSALKRISSWRSRGSLPVLIDVTASIVEIQHMDPFFRQDQLNDEAGSVSEEVLANLYCMAIVRLVNGAVEKTRKKELVSIAVAAEEIGIPRMLIDIRHEGSHRELPSLKVVRSASIKRVWQGLIPSEIMQDFFNMNDADWIKLNLKPAGFINNGWSNTWIITCHALWTWRNQEEHNPNYMRPLNPITHILKRREEYMQAVMLFKTAGDNQQRLTDREWKPPIQHVVKLNTDGSSINNVVAGCGGVIRNHEGDCLGGFSKFVGRGNALLAEFWGLLEGLQLTQKIGYRRVEINVDSLQVVEAINTGKVEQMDCIAILRQILAEINTLEMVIISHVYRSANTCADALAKMGSRENSIIFYNKAPGFLQDLLDADRSGILIPIVGSL